VQALKMGIECRLPVSVNRCPVRGRRSFLIQSLLKGEFVDAQKKRWRIRYSLRSSLVAFTAVAVLAWFYWTGRFIWQQAELEHSAKQLNCGQTFEDAVTVCEQWHVAAMSGASGPQGELYGWIRYQWPNATYLLIARLKQSVSGTLDSCELTSVRVYRISAVPHDYLPQTARGRQVVINSSRRGESKAEADNWAYESDFLAELLGEIPDTLSFKYELVHSDPPAQALPK
jgi:hypothetical protein